MVRKVLSLVLPVGVAVLIASQWTEINRYLKVKQMSMGDGHPEVVPIKGQQSYPTDPSKGDLDGTGDFDSASRGGPDADHRPEAHPGRERAGDEPGRQR